MFAAPSFAKPIDTLADVAEFLKEGKLNIDQIILFNRILYAGGVVPLYSAGTSIAYLFASATFGTHKEIYNYYNPDKTHVSRKQRFEMVCF